MPLTTHTFKVHTKVLSTEVIAKALDHQKVGELLAKTKENLCQ